MFKLANQEYMYLFLLIPFLVVLYIVVSHNRKRLLKKFGELAVISQLMPDVSNKRVNIKFIILLLALSSIIVAILGPQFGSKLETVKRKGVEIMIALDVSNSMMAEDIKPNRLANAKRAIAKLVDKLRDDKIGMIVFAGDAYVQLPITADYISAKMFLSTINTDIVGKQGTAIGSAIELAMKSFSPDNDKQKALIIITDGENHEDDAVERAKEASEKGIVIHTIGMGLPQGSPIPLGGRYGKSNYRKDNQGNVIISKLDDVKLNQIASAANGIYVRASNTKSILNAIFDEIESMEKSEIDSKIYSDYEENFQYFVFLALFLLLIDFIILERKNKIFKNINLFK